MSTSRRKLATEDVTSAASPVVPAAKSTSENRISQFLASFKSLAEPSAAKWNALSLGQRTLFVILALPIAILPIIWFLLASPVLFIGVAIFYSILYGPRTFVQHSEAALREHLHVSKQNIQKVHENADMLKMKADKVGTSLVEMVYLLFYTCTVYSLRTVEFIISKLQCLSGMLKSKNVSAKQKLASKHAE